MATSATAFYDAVVAASGGDYTDIASAITDNKRTIYVKSGTYAGFTQDQAQSKIFIEPGSTISSAIVFSATNCSLVVGAGSTLDDVQFSSAGGYFRLENGCTTGYVNLQGDRCFFDGGGWGTTVTAGSWGNPALDFNGIDCIAQNTSINSKSPASNGDALYVSSGRVRAVVRLINVLDSDDDGLQSLGDDTLVIGCNFQSFDDDGLVMSAHRPRIIGCGVLGGGGSVSSKNGILTVGDNGVIVGNTVYMANASSDPVELLAGSDNNVVVGNRLDGASNNAGTGNTISNNEETAF